MSTQTASIETITTATGTDGGEHEPLWTPCPPPASVNIGDGWFDPM